MRKWKIFGMLTLTLLMTSLVMITNALCEPNDDPVNPDPNPEPSEITIYINTSSSRTNLYINGGNPNGGNTNTYINGRRFEDAFNDIGHLWGDVDELWEGVEYLAKELNETNYALTVTMKGLNTTMFALNKTVGAVNKHEKALYTAYLEIGDLKVKFDETSMEIENLEKYTDEQLTIVFNGLNSLRLKLDALSTAVANLGERHNILEGRHNALEEKHNLLLGHVLERDKWYLVGFVVLFGIVVTEICAQTMLWRKHKGETAKT